jgi:hypothetical protein
MPVIYNGEILVPAPLVSIQRNMIKGPDGRPLRSEYIIQLTGTIVNVDTDLDSGDAFDYTGMEGVLAEQRRIRNIFASDGRKLEITSPPDGGPNTIDLYCTVESVNFSQGVWVQRCEYTISLKANGINVDQEDLSDLANFSENWNVTENEDSTFSLTHQLQATGQLLYSEDGENDPLAAAKSWVQARMYVNTIDGVLTPAPSPSGNVNLAGLLVGLGSGTTDYYNKSIVESVDPNTYSWNVTESFLYHSGGSYREEWSASVNYENDNPYKAIMNIAGSVFGFADKNSNRAVKLSHASGAFESTVKPNMYTRLNVYTPSELTLLPVPTSKQFSYEAEGVIRYSYGYIANAGSLIANATDESVSINDTNPTDIFAQIQVPGRVNGPVVQNMNTKTLPERTISITATILPSGSITTTGSLLSAYLAKPNTNDIIAALRPSAGYYYIKQDTEEWNPIKRQYARNVGWTIQTEGSSIDGQDPANNNPA